MKVTAVQTSDHSVARLSPFTRMVLLTALYFLGGLLGKQASFLSGSVALVWPPAGIALGAILLFGYRFWPGVALGAVLFSCMNGLPLGFFTLGTALGNTMGAIVCTYLLRRILGFENAMERTRDVVGYIGLACFLGTTVNAAFNVVSLAYAGELAWPDVFPAILLWWVPNALAGLVVAPFIVVWATPSTLRWRRGYGIELAACALGLVFGTLVSFHSWIGYGVQNYALAYLPFPFLVWGALRFGPRGAATGTLVVSAMAIHSLLSRRGPFVSPSEEESLMLIGSYIGMLAITNMLFAAAAAERRQAERALTENERRLRAILEDQTDLICRFQPDGTLTFVNGAYCRFHGRSADELLGRNFLQALCVEDLCIPLSWFETLPSEQPVVSFDHQVRGAGGVLVWHQYTVRRLFHEQGRTREFQAVIRDITHRKQVETSLQASEGRYRSLVANLPDIVWTGNATRELVYVSDNVEKVLGYTAAELTRVNRWLWWDRIHPQDRDRVQRTYDRLFDQEQAFDAEFRFQRKDGIWIWLQSRAPSTCVRDGVRCADGLSSDVTERRRVEEALQRAKDGAEAANRAKSQFLASMSHELRTPLNAILGFSEILSDGTFGQLNPRQVRYVNNILTSGRHLLQLINDILDLSKVEAGRLELNCTAVNFARFLRNVENIVKTMAQKKEIALEFEVEPGLPPVFADEPKLKQILYNLLSNAIKFTAPGGRVRVVARLLANPRSAHNEELLSLSVCDNGIGIHPRDQERIFGAFERVDCSYSRQEEGTGLGLALTKRLVELHEGEITLVSDGVVGNGCTFTVLLPLLSASLFPYAQVESPAGRCRSSGGLTSPQREPGRPDQAVPGTVPGIPGDATTAGHRLHF